MWNLAEHLKFPIAVTVWNRRVKFSEQILFKFLIWFCRNTKRERDPWQNYPNPIPLWDFLAFPTLPDLLFNFHFPASPSPTAAIWHQGEFLKKKKKCTGDKNFFKSVRRNSWNHKNNSAQNVPDWLQGTESKWNGVRFLGSEGGRGCWRETWKEGKGQSLAEQSPQTQSSTERFGGSKHQRGRGVLNAKKRDFFMEQWLWIRAAPEEHPRAPQEELFSFVFWQLGWSGWHLLLRFWGEKWGCHLNQLLKFLFIIFLHYGVCTSINSKESHFFLVGKNQNQTILSPVPVQGSTEPHHEELHESCTGAAEWQDCPRGWRWKQPLFRKENTPAPSELQRSSQASRTWPSTETSITRTLQGS